MEISSQKIAAFKSIQKQLKDVKQKEADMRIEICDKLLRRKPVGTHSFNIGNFRLKVTKKITTSIDKDLLSAIYDDFTPEEAACFKFAPSFLNGKYKELEDKTNVDAVLETKPAMPTIVIEHME